MNDLDVKELFASAVAHPDVDRIDTDAVLLGGRRRRRVRASAAIASVLAVVALVGSVALVGRPRPVPPVVADPSTLTVTCSPDGIRLSSDVVEATSAGVVITTSSTMPPGSALNYRWPARDSALPADAYRPMTEQAETWTMTAPPGPLTLSCAGLRHAVPFGGAHTVTVTDPHGFWSSATAAELGCAPGPQLAVLRPPGIGDSPEAAVQDYLTHTGRSPAEAGVTLARLRIGYPDAPTQLWLVSVDGVPTMTLDVDRTGTTYEAHGSIMCAALTTASPTG